MSTATQVTGVAVDWHAEPLEELPPSAKLVYKTIQYADGKLTHSQIVERAMLSGRTTRYALNRLQEEGLLEKQMCFKDARKRYYTLVEER